MAFENPEYQKILDVSARVAWKLDEVLTESDRLDRARPLLPESLAQVDGIRCLDGAERLALNQIRGSTYLSLFGLVEKFSLPFVLDHAKARLGRDPFETRALLGFAEEEAKHIQLFERFAERFAEDLETTCPVIGPAEQIAEEVLSRHPLGVALAILHIEWSTQEHYVSAAKGDASLDPLFSRLLHQHWLEESQHARLDGLVVHAIADELSPIEVRAGLADYEQIWAGFEAGFDAQVELDLATLQQIILRELPPADLQAIRAAQRRAYRWTFVDSGRRHPRFRATYDALASGLR